MNKEVVSKPIKRSNVRLFLGKTCYSLKRYMFWIFGELKFAGKSETKLPIVCFSHETPLLRKLKDVDMYLQHNKITNLKIATSKVNKVVIYPGEVFSYWKLIGKPTKRKGYLKGWYCIEKWNFCRGHRRQYLSAF